MPDHDKIKDLVYTTCESVTYAKQLRYPADQRSITS